MNLLSDGDRDESRASLRLHGVHRRSDGGEDSGDDGELHFDNLVVCWVSKR